MSYKDLEEKINRKTDKEIETNKVLIDTPDIFIGQNKTREKIKILIEKSKVSKMALPHMLFVGDEGLGKETLSKIIAKELNYDIKIVNPDQIEKEEEIVSGISNLNPNGIMVVNKIETLPAKYKKQIIQSCLDFKIDIILGKADWARKITLDLPPFTLIATAQNLSKLSDEFKKIFFAYFEFSNYSNDELEQILLSKIKLSGLIIDNESVKLISEKSKGLPGKLNAKFKRIAQYAKLSNTKSINLQMVKECLEFSLSENKPERNIDRNIPKEIRIEVWRRDSGKCVECSSQDKLEYDHIIPVSKGGSNTARNIRLLCEKCNRQKHDNI